MANWSDLKAAIAKVIRDNGNQEITGSILQNALNSIISNVGKDCSFAGIATPATNPGVPDGNVFYLATEAGTYANFSGIEIASGEAVILEWRGSWVKKTSGFATQQHLLELDSIIIQNDDERAKIKSIISDIYVIDRLSRGGIWKIQYFQYNYTAGKLLIQLVAPASVVGEERKNYVIDASTALAGKIYKMNLYTTATPYDNIDILIRMSSNYVYDEDTVYNITSLNTINTNNTGNIKPNIVNLIDKNLELNAYSIFPYKPNDTVFGSIIYGEYGVAINKYGDTKKLVLNRGCFDCVDNIDTEVANTIRKIVKDIELINGFDKTKQYFIKDIKWGAGGEESYFYIKLCSLPSAEWEFEWRISKELISKGTPCYITDGARHRTIKITLAETADDIFTQSVIYYQDSLLLRDVVKNKDNNEIRYHIVTVPNHDDYIIRNTVHSLNGIATYYDRYVVDVPEGEYFEMDIRVPNFVTVRGRREKNTIIRLDGTSEKVAPNDLSIGTGGIPIKNIDIIYKHIFWHVTNSTIENMTLEVNSVKYAIHQDSNVQEYKSYCKNVTFKENGSIIRLVGIGCWANQHQNYINCTFENNNVQQAIVYHNWNNQKAPGSITIQGCISQKDLIQVEELGSEQQDIVKVINCLSRTPYEGNITLVKSSSTGYEGEIYIKVIIEGKSMQYYNPSGYNVMVIA